MNWNHAVKLSSRSTLGIASGFHQGKHHELTLLQHRMFTNSRRSPNKPAGSEKSSMSCADETSTETQKDTENNGSNKSSGTTPLDQKSANAILTQLSSPPNLLTMSRILATPYLSYLLISHNQCTSLATSSSAPVGCTDATATAAVSSPIAADAAVDVTTATAADALSTIATNIDQSSTPIFALSLFLVMGFTDYLDGYIARTYPSTATVLGTYLDPFADKFLISAMSLTLCYTGSLPGMLVGLWIARDVGIVGSVYWLVRRETIRKRGSNKNKDGNDNDSINIAVMDPQNTPFKVEASFLSKVNTTLQIGLIALGIAGEVPSIDIPPELMTSLIWITAGTTIGSSLGYLDLSAFKKSGNK